MKTKLFGAITMIAVALLPLDAGAFKLKLKKNDGGAIDYASWVAAEGLPGAIDGVAQFYPVSIAVEADDDSAPADTVAIIKGHISTKGLDKKQVFLAAMVYASENFNADEGKEGFEEIDYDGMKFRSLLKTTQGSNSTETTYTRSLQLTAVDGGFDFVVTEIDCRYREKGLIPRTLRLEKLHPDRNIRHNEIVREMVAVNSAYLADMAEYISSRKKISSPNYGKLKKGSVIEGMNGDEVTIILGPPLNKRKSGERDRWIYSNDYVVIFTDGIVTKIVR